MITGRFTSTQSPPRNPRCSLKDKKLILTPATLQDIQWIFLWSRWKTQIRIMRYWDGLINIAQSDSTAKWASPLIKRWSKLGWNLIWCHPKWWWFFFSFIVKAKIVRTHNIDSIDAKSNSSTNKRKMHVYAVGERTTGTNKKGTSRALKPCANGWESAMPKSLSYPYSLEIL